jgi:hypothetical protein
VPGRRCSQLQRRLGLSVLRRPADGCAVSFELFAKAGALSVARHSAMRLHATVVMSRPSAACNRWLSTQVSWRSAKSASHSYA